MKISLQRDLSTDLSTLGRLTLPDNWEARTLERPEVQIGPGTYRILMTWSPRFNRRLPELQNVPGRTHIRIHPGNFPQESQGCILIGTSGDSDRLYESRKASYLLNIKIQETLDSGEIVEIVIS